MRKPKAGRKPASPLRRRSRTAKRAVPSPLLEWLFQRMADESPGVLRALSWSTGKVRLQHTVLTGPFDNVTRVFSIVMSSPDATDGTGEPLELVEVQVRGLPSVVVSRIPSAVLAVALR